MWWGRTGTSCCALDEDTGWLTGGQEPPGPRGLTTCRPGFLCPPGPLVIRGLGPVSLATLAREGCLLCPKEEWFKSPREGLYWLSCS